MLALVLCLGGARTAGAKAAERDDAEVLRGIGYGFAPESLRDDWDMQVSYQIVLSG